MPPVLGSPPGAFSRAQSHFHPANPPLCQHLYLLLFTFQSCPENRNECKHVKTTSLNPFRGVCVQDKEHSSPRHHLAGSLIQSPWDESLPVSGEEANALTDCAHRLVWEPRACAVIFALCFGSCRGRAERLSQPARSESSQHTWGCRSSSLPAASSILHLSTSKRCSSFSYNAREVNPLIITCNIRKKKKQQWCSFLYPSLTGYIFAVHWALFYLLEENPELPSVFQVELEHAAFSIFRSTFPRNTTNQQILLQTWEN